jgi:hypothetical protein
MSEMNKYLVLAVIASCYWQRAGYGELFLTAEVVPTVDLPGFETYRITATSELGNVVGFDFTEVGAYGVIGPLGQVNPLGQQTVFTDLNSQFGAHDPSQDTQFLVSGEDVISLHTGESSSSLHGAFAFKGDLQFSVGNSVPFLQIATPQASAVSLKGAFAIRSPNDEILERYIDIALSVIPVGPAPAVSVRPVVNPLPELTPAPVLPPIVNPPIGSPPVDTPISPPELNPAPIIGPQEPPLVADAQLFLTAELMPTIGRPGFGTYRITATSNLGSVVAADFTQASSFGIFGPLGQVHPGGEQTVFTNLNSSFGAADPAQDSQFLINSDDVLSLFTEESENSLHGAFAFIGDRQFTAGQSLPFVQLSTSDASAVNLTGALVIRRANGELVETMIDVSLADITIGPAPTVDLLPIPDPIPDPVVLPAPVTNPPPAPDSVAGKEPLADQPADIDDVVANPDVEPDVPAEPDPEPGVDLPIDLPIIDRPWLAIDETYVPYLDWYLADELTDVLLVTVPTFSLTDADYVLSNDDRSELASEHLNFTVLRDSATFGELRAAKLFTAANSSGTLESLRGAGEVAQIPEPSSLGLFLVALSSCTMCVRRDS